MFEGNSGCGTVVKFLPVNLMAWDRWKRKKNQIDQERFLVNLEKINKIY